MRNIKKYKILICISIFIILFGLNVYAVEFNFWNSSNNETIEDKNACIIVKYKPECTDKTHKKPAFICISDKAHKNLK